MLTYTLNHYQLFFLVLLRMVAFIGASPILSLRAWPAVAKLGLAALLGMMIAPQIHTVVPSPFQDPGAYIVVALQETLAGLLLGFLMTMLFATVSVAGQLVDVQIGFSTSTLFDPQLGVTTGITGNFLTILFTLYFLGLDGLDGLVLALLNSYRFIPLGSFHLPALSWEFLAQAMGVMMVVALQMVAPILVALLLTDVTFALLSRTAPQLNVFVVEFPAKLLIGLSLFAVAMPGVVYVFSQLFAAVFNQLNGLLLLLKG